MILPPLDLSFVFGGPCGGLRLQRPGGRFFALAVHIERPTLPLEAISSSFSLVASYW